MSILDCFPCRLDVLRTAFKAKALVPFSRPGSSALTAGGAPHARLCEHCFSRTLVWQSSALDIRGYNLSGTKARTSWHKHFVWYSALGIKDFSATVLESGLRQGDSKCAGSLSTCPSYSPGNRHALLAHRPEETWPAQRHGIFVLFVCCPWRTQHWGPLRFAKSLYLAPKAGYWAPYSSAGLGSSPEINYTWAEIITQLPCHWNLSFSPDTANETT